MNTYRFVLFLHIASAVLLIGGSVAGILVRAAVRRCATLHEGRTLLALGRPLSIMNPMSALTLMGTGVYLSSVGRWWATPWVLVALVMWVVNTFIARAAVGGTVERLAEHLASGDGPMTVEADALRNSTAWTIGGDLLVAHDLGSLLLMTLKPSLAPSLWVMALAVGVVLVMARLRRLGAPSVSDWPAGAAPVE